MDGCGKKIYISLYIFLWPWKKSYDQTRLHIKKQRHYFAEKVHLVRAMVFPVVMHGYGSCTLKKAEHRRIDAFELWYWRRFLRVPWTARSNQSILKEISPAHTLEGLLLKLKLQYFGHLMWRTDWLEKFLMLRKIEGGRRRERQRMRWLDGITDSMDMSLSSGSWWWTGKPDMLQSIGSQRVDTTERLNWTECSLIQDHHPSHNYLVISLSVLFIESGCYVYSFLIILNVFLSHGRWLSTWRNCLSVEA